MPDRIPLVDVAASHRALERELFEALRRVLTSGRYVQGAETHQFEERFAKYCGARHAIAVDSGTAGLHLALLACGLRPGDEVLTTPFSFVATGTAILHANLRPVLADIRASDLTLDPARLEAAITPRTRAIMPVHLFGHFADMEPILAVARARGLKVIEDACQSHGARRSGRIAGTWGDAGVFSFYPSKNLAAAGDGGAILTNDARMAEDLRRRRDHGRTGKYEHGVLGWNYRMDEFQAAVLNVKLPHLDAWNDRRRALAARYREKLSGLSVALPPPSPDAVWHLYVIRTPRRDALKDHLERLGIEAGVHYPLPLHLQPPFADLGYREGSFPEAERAAREVLSLPMYPELGEDGVDRVCAAIREFMA